MDVEPTQPVPANSAPAPMPKPSPPPPPPPPTPLSDKTVVIPPHMADLQAQIEIAFSQIKHLSVKTNDMEQHMDLLEQHKGVQLETNELKEPPMNPADFVQKLLKLAEHVIVLEKEMARLKAQFKVSPAPTQTRPAPRQPTRTPNPVPAIPTPKPTKPPIMPI